MDAYDVGDNLYHKIQDLEAKVDLLEQETYYLAGLLEEKDYLLFKHDIILYKLKKEEWKRNAVDYVNKKSTRF